MARSQGSASHLSHLPREVLEQVALLLDTASLLRLAATCHLLRAAAHGACVRLLAAQAAQCHSMAESLASLGWARARASLHSPSPCSCPCFRLLGGPWHHWRKLDRRAETVLKPDTNICVGLGCAVAGGRVYTAPCARSVVAMDRAGALGDRAQVVEYSHLPQYNRFPLQVAAHQATLVVKSLASAALHRMGEYTIEVFHAQTGARVCALDPLRGITDTRSLGQLEIADIVLAENTIAVHLMFDVNQEAELEDEIEELELRDNETQVWRINTLEPAAGDLVLERVVRDPLERHGLLDPGLLSLNSRYMVRVGTAPAAHHLQVGSRAEQEQEMAVVPVTVSGAPGEQGRASVRVVRLCRGASPLLALGLELGVEHLELGHAYRVLVQVVHLGTREVLLQHDFGTSNHIDETMRLCWCGPHLLVTCRKPSGHADLYTWQPGLRTMRPTPARLLIGSAHFALEFLHADMEEMVVAVVNFGQERTSIQSHRPRQRIEC